MMWGRHRENGIWLAKCSRRKLMLRGGDSVYAAYGRLRVRLIKPWAA